MFGFSCVGEQRNHILYSESPTEKKVPLWSYAASIRGGVKGWKSETVPHNFFYEHYILINITRKEPISSTKKVIKPQTPN